MFDQMTVYDWITNYVPGGHGSQLGTLLNAAYNEEYGAETTGQSALNLIYLLGYQAGPGTFSVYGVSDERYHIAGGNANLPVAIAGALPAGSVHLGSAMTAIARNSAGSISVSFANGKTVTADHVILCMSFAVLRTLNYSKAGFDTLKQTAITQLGAGRNAKLNLQFNSRPWNADGSTGSLYSDQPFQSAWDVTRGQSGTTGILVEYPGASVAQSMGQSSPYTTTATNRQVEDLREPVPVPDRADLPRHHRPVERQSDALHPLHRPEPPLLLLLLEARPVHRLQRLRRRPPGQHPLRRGTLLHQLPGLHGRRRLRRRPRRKRNPHRPHTGLAHNPRQISSRADCCQTCCHDGRQLPTNDDRPGTSPQGTATPGQVWTVRSLTTNLTARFESLRVSGRG